MNFASPVPAQQPNARKKWGKPAQLPIAMAEKEEDILKDFLSDDVEGDEYDSDDFDEYDGTATIELPKFTPKKVSREELEITPMRRPSSARARAVKDIIVQSVDFGAGIKGVENKAKVSCLEVSMMS